MHTESWSIHLHTHISEQHATCTKKFKTGFDLIWTVEWLYLWYFLPNMVGFQLDQNFSWKYLVAEDSTFRGVLMTVRSHIHAASHPKKRQCGHEVPLPQAWCRVVEGCCEELWEGGGWAWCLDQDQLCIWMAWLVPWFNLLCIISKNMDPHFIAICHAMAYLRFICLGVTRSSLVWPGWIASLSWPTWTAPSSSLKSFWGCWRWRQDSFTMMALLTALWIPGLVADSWQ